MSADKSKNRRIKGKKNRGNSSPTATGAVSSSAIMQPARRTVAAPPRGPSEPDPVGPVPPLFRSIDWVAFAVTTLVAMIGYYWTLAPDLTLEDSGELAVGSFYAAIPHPPGYPVWTLYTWLFTELLPFANVAWRVAMSSAVAGALSCGFIAMMVSRGSAMILEGIEEFKGMEPRIEAAICVVAGYVGGMLMGFNGFMWSQAVIVEVYTLSVLSLVGQLIMLMRWMHAPHQFRYLAWSFFWGGIAFTNHQTLVVAMVAVEIAVLARSPRVGRDMFIIAAASFLLLLLVNAVKTGGISFLGSNASIFAAFKCIGAGCVIIAVWLSIITRMEFDLKKFFKSIGCYFAWVGGAFFYIYMALAGMTNPPMQWGYPRTVEGFIHALTRGQYEKANPTSGLDRFFGQLQTYTAGAIEEFNLVYLLIGLIPLVVIFYRRIERTERVWLGAVSGVYTLVCLVVLAKDFSTNKAVIPGMMCGYMFLLIGVTPFLFFRHSGGRNERAWLAGLCSTFLFLSLLLIFLLNPQPDKQAQQLNRVFFTASYVPLTMGIGYGVAIIAAAVAMNFRFWRPILILGGACSMAGAIYARAGLEQKYAVDIFGANFGIFLAGAALAMFIFFRERLKLNLLLGLLCLFPVYTFLAHWTENEQRGHLFGYWFGHDMFTPPFEDVKGKPLYPEMTRDTVLFGGTDPGRFCPTYMIFCESFIKPHQRRDPEFDRRDVYIITQNALADATYLMYIRAHYNRSTQIDPPFFQEIFRSHKEKELGVTNSLLAKLVRPLDSLFLGIGDSIEQRRRAGTSRFEPDHFTDLPALVKKLNAGEDPLSRYLVTQLSEKTRELLKQPDRERAIRKALAAEFTTLIERELADEKKMLGEGGQLNGKANELIERLKKESDQAKAIKMKEEAVAMRTKLGELQGVLTSNLFRLYRPERFSHVKLSQKLNRFIAENPQSHTRIRLNRLLFEEAYPNLIAKSLGGLYPDLEIHTPSVEDSQKSFQEYIDDAQRRLKHDMEKPTEAKQIRPGENVFYDTNSGKVSVSGQVAVMAINGLLTKVIFDKNPDHEFFLEESFPLEWMYPHLSPFGIILKINRQPIPEMTQEMVDRDHRFWSLYSDRLIGNWITYDTPVKEICDFVDRVFIKRDFSDYKGDITFIRDGNAQKAFSKLRSALAGAYFWRINHAGRMGNLAEQQRMIKESDFAFRHSFAFCPYSPEAVFRYTNLLISLQRIDDALLIANTFLKLDPRNNSAQGLVAQLTALKASQGGSAGVPGNNPQAQLAAAEAQFQANPANLQLGGQLFNTYRAAGKTNEAIAVVDKLMTVSPPDSMVYLTAVDYYGQLGQTAKRQLALTRLIPEAGKLVANPNANIPSLQVAAQAYNYAGNTPLLEQVMIRLAGLQANSPETWFDLAGIQAVMGKSTQAVASLSNSIRLSDARLKSNPGALNIRQQTLGDPRFTRLRPLPGYQQVMGGSSTQAPAPVTAPASAPAPPPKK